MKETKKKLRLGVVGTGYLGKFHAEKYAHMDDVELVGVVDTDRSRALAVADKLSTKAFFNHRDLLGIVDAVSIVVPTPEHYSVALDFLKRDIDILIEKPITATLNEADELLNQAESRGLIIQVGHLERFNPAVVALAGILKKPMFVESHRLSLFKERGTDISVVLDLMIHDIDIILNFVKSEIKSIQASGIPVISSHVDIANARLEFKSGCIANITASRISTKNERKVRLFQRDAYISVDFANQNITIIGKDAKTVDGLIPGMGIKKIEFSQTDVLKEELFSFVDSVKSRKVPAVTGQMGRDALKIALNTMEQIRSANTRFLGL